MLVLLSFLLSALLGGCGGTSGPGIGTATPPADGPALKVGVPASPVTATWLQYKAGTAGGQLVTLDVQGHVDLSPVSLLDSCHPNAVDTALAPNGALAAVSTTDRCGPSGMTTIRIVDLDSGTISGSVDGGSGGIAWSPDSQRLLLADGSLPGASLIVSTSGQTIATLPAGFQPDWAPSHWILQNVYSDGEHDDIFDGNGRLVQRMVGFQNLTWESDGIAAGPGGKGTLLISMHATTLRSRYCNPGPVSPGAKMVVHIESDSSAIPPDIVHSHVALCNTESGQEHAITPDYIPSVLGTPGWLPDGRLVMRLGETVVIMTGSSEHYRVIARSDPGASFGDVSTVR